MAAGQQLGDPWKRWWDFLGEEGSWREDASKRARIHTRLLRFSSAHWDQPAWIDAVVSGLARGKSLVEAGVRWADPAVGLCAASKLICPARRHHCAELRMHLRSSRSLAT